MGAWALSVEDGIGRLVFNDPASEVNILTFAHIQGFDEILSSIAERGDMKALLISSGKPRVFIAGADIREIERIRSAEDAFAKAEAGKAILKKLEDLKIPTICAINGACLGGGFELALACRYRVASFSSFVKIGLPEVNLGILPGFGGSIRLPRLVGLLKSLPYILTGRILSAEEALKSGMIDRLFPEKSFVDDALSFTQDVAQGRWQRPIRKKYFLTSVLEDTPFGRSIVMNRARKDVLAKTQGHYPAPLAIIALVAKTYGCTGPDGYRLESEHFSRLAVTDVSKNLIRVFFLTEKYKKTRWTDSPLKSDGVQKCGVVGAGVMGGGIAQLVSYRDISVRVKDVNEKALAGALKEAMGLYQGLLGKRKIKPYQIENKMNLISVGLDNRGLQNCQMILEAVVEDMGIKKKVFKELSEVVGPDTILASNTSSLSVTEMALDCRAPERVVGLHFFNPVSRMPLVEVIRAGKSSTEALERTVLFARRLGKTAILVEDKPGFLVNRLLLPYLNEAAYLLGEGFLAEEIDRIAERFGMPMGPVELADQVGIDVGYKVAHILEQAFGARMKVAPALEEAKSKGLLGKKSGKGFYLYDGRKKTVNPEIRPEAVSKKSSEEDALKRMIYIMINEAGRCLEEKVVDSPATVDVGMILGAGFPPFRGGLLRYADSAGLGEVLKDLERFSREVDAKRFEPSAYLRDRVNQGKNFHES